MGGAGNRFPSACVTYMNAMKLIPKLTLAAVALVFSVNYAQAEDPGPRWQAEQQRQQQADRNRSTTTVAVYAHRGLGQREIVRTGTTETHLEYRTDAHGRTQPEYVRNER